MTEIAVVEGVAGNAGDVANDDQGKQDFGGGSREFGIGWFLEPASQGSDGAIESFDDGVGEHWIDGHEVSLSQAVWSGDDNQSEWIGYDQD